MAKPKRKDKKPPKVWVDKPKFKMICEPDHIGCRLERIEDAGKKETDN